MSLHRWRHEDRSTRARFAGLGFGAMDPGRNGYLLTFEAGNPEPVGFADPMVPESCAQALELAEARLVVLESQYVTSLARAKSVVELSFTMGIGVGWLACYFGGVDQELGESVGLHTVEVAPSTWQARQHLVNNRPREKGGAIKLALAVAALELGGVEQWKAAGADTRTGIAAAYGIAGWWKAVAW